MNAPFKAAGLRDPFNAFVCDDDTLELIRVAAADMGWPIEKCNKGGLRNAVQSLSVSASPNILFVDMSESGDPINDINAQNNRMAQGENTAADITRHTEGWIKAHQKTIDQWLAQARAAAK